MFREYAPYVPVAERRRQAAAEMQKLTKKGQTVTPVLIKGRNIANTFWGKAWCENLERYSDYANRVPRGRTYVRNGSVVDLQIDVGDVRAIVSGSSLYKVAVKVTAVPAPRWSAICKDAAGVIDSLVELLQGCFSTGVMERLCQQQTGLFPSPQEIRFSCSCPDSASMCKHIAAVLYGIGARLDLQPELLFRLRAVDEKQLITEASGGLGLAKKGKGRAKMSNETDLSDLFGIELAPGPTPKPQHKATAHAKAKAKATKNKPVLVAKTKKSLLR